MGNLDRIERQHVSRARAYAASTNDALMCLVFFSENSWEKVVIFDEKSCRTFISQTGVGLGPYTQEK